jgi:hypothetical protein
VGEVEDGFERRPGRARTAMKTRATDSAESMDMIHVIGKRIGFTVDCRIEVYVTEPSRPPGGSHMAMTELFLRRMKGPE